MDAQPNDDVDGERTGDAERALDLLDLGLARLKAKETARIGRRNLWLAHHWPDDYAERCVMLGSQPVCRRCAALYPLGFLVAFAAAWGAAPWPPSIDPWPIWLLSLPATIAYVGEALGVFRYHVKVQVAATLIAAVAFGRGLGYELEERWSPEFWGPVAVFGGIWYAATVLGAARRQTASDQSARRRDQFFPRFRGGTGRPIRAQRRRRPVLPRCCRRFRGGTGRRRSERSDGVDQFFLGVVGGSEEERGGGDQSAATASTSSSSVL